ncbi:phosphoenolpyruvate--protein phosphotransferase [Couchioplanes caeruleus]|uniref:Phosphocarrier protein HPr n=2 Tax=Couchioplanes caeruleus TaxID=56438 RepID=A0A1K0FK42_9ACTN|nr:phosphoenolpyruvate--protein phosphotransferase [Couchioplanes caeruleus]OJF13239.1 phosphoenolpyruvate--protein phosphotransferase [Couchioplanes caeruleus subsp. caeruleus]ROP34026.1 phosphocarrier protein HPr /phosphoenolpyruvate--protein phosphotransferase /dihydroxyacetone kinase DhaM subunit [Couchioplanes caeruleus]
MVGLVVVCHSRALARAAVDLAAEMVRDSPVPIEIAAGLDETTFGTDAVAVTEAVAAADHGDGVVVLMDLGSAVLSAELALDLLDDDRRSRIVLCAAPLVEGLVAAAVAAAGGAGRPEVAAEATNALAGKLSHLAPADAPGEASLGDGPSSTVTVTNRHGLHARPAARLVATARAFEARVEVRNRSTGSPWVPATSLTRIATLAVGEGQDLDIRASGPQAREAVAHVVALAGRSFDDTPGDASTAPPRTDTAPPRTKTALPRPPGHAAAGVTAGRPASAGVGIGPARHADDAVPDMPEVASRGPDEEWHRIEDAMAAVRRDLHRLRASTARDAGEHHAAIFDAHLLLLDDADLLADVRSRIADGSPAPQAWHAATERVATGIEAVPDPYLRARAIDVRAVGRQMIRMLVGVPGATKVEDGVLIAADLAPGDAAELDPRVAGVLLAFGSPAAHGAILARTRGIPMVTGVGPAVLDVAPGTQVALDGATGEVVVAPDDAVLASFRRRAGEQASRRARAAACATAPAVTRDGTTVAVGANVGSVADARAAVARGADLVGLIRTEFLFLGRDTAPDTGEQEAAYREIAEAFGGRRITVRTLDVGGDKPLPYVAAAGEDNPFLGVRGIRHSLAHPALLADQLLAIALVARAAPVSVMFPMVSTVAELVHARRMLTEAIARAGGDEGGLRVGLMMEVPAAALKAAAFAPYADFFSVGTNDLTQYALAAERGNAAVAALADGLDPGVLRLIDAVCRGAGGRVAVSVCGELAGDEAAVPLLLGYGVRELSVAPRAVPVVKEAVRAAGLDHATKLAARALQLEDAAAVRDLAANAPHR